MAATLFVAVVPPPAAAGPLIAAVDVLREAAPELAWVAPPRWHLTLCFLGRAEPSEDLLARLARVAHRHQPPTLQLAGGGRFGQNVLYSKIKGDLKPLAAGCARAAVRAGYPVDDRPFHAHLTLARSRRKGPDLRPLAARLAGVEGPVWTARELLLMSGQQPEYATLAAWPLGRAAGPAP